MFSDSAFYVWALEGYHEMDWTGTFHTFTYVQKSIQIGCAHDRMSSQVFS